MFWAHFWTFPFLRQSDQKGPNVATSYLSINLGWNWQSAAASSFMVSQSPFSGQNSRHFCKTWIPRRAMRLGGLMFTRNFITKYFLSHYEWQPTLHSIPHSPYLLGCQKNAVSRILPNPDCPTKRASQINFPSKVKTLVKPRQAK